MKKRKTSKVVTKIFAVLFVVAVLVAGFWMVVRGFTALEHYSRVYKNPLVVTATVTSYGTYDDEGDTDYRSYVSYEVDGKKYEKIRYEDKDYRSDLNPIGTQVELKVSPEDPSSTISSLKSDTIMLVGFFFVLSIAAALWNIGISNMRSKKNSAIPDTEVLEKDLKLTVLGRFSLAIWILVSVLLFVLVWRYPVIMPRWISVAAVVCLILWLISVFKAARDIRLINNAEYEIRRDVLIDKNHDSSDGDTYELTYKSQDKEWKTTVTKEVYHNTQKGDTVVAVHLPGKEKPLIHYDVSGDAS